MRGHILEPDEASGEPGADVIRIDEIAGDISSRETAKGFGTGYGEGCTDNDKNVSFTGHLVGQGHIGILIEHHNGRPELGAIISLIPHLDRDSHRIIFDTSRVQAAIR